MSIEEKEILAINKHFHINVTSLICDQEYQNQPLKRPESMMGKRSSECSNHLQERVNLNLLIAAESHSNRPESAMSHSELTSFRNTRYAEGQEEDRRIKSGNRETKFEIDAEGDQGMLNEVTDNPSIMLKKFHPDFREEENGEHDYTGARGMVKRDLNKHVETYRGYKCCQKCKTPLKPNEIRTFKKQNSFFPTTPAPFCHNQK